MWYEPELYTAGASLYPPLAATFTNINTSTFHTSWIDPNAWFVGFKGGDNQAAHGKLDGGSFVLDWGGERWVSLLGAESYSLTGIWEGGTQDGARWAMYRNKTEGGNTLCISDKVQIPLDYSNQYYMANSICIKDGLSDPNNFYSVMDLTEAYSAIPNDTRNVPKVYRGIKLLNKEQLLIQDEVMSINPVEVIWNCHTLAKVVLDGNKAYLTLNGKAMTAEILSPANAVFEKVTCKPLAPLNSNSGVTKFVVILPLAVQNSTIAVRFYPTGTTPNLPAIDNLFDCQ
jgi:hypothetical protein